MLLFQDNLVLLEITNVMQSDTSRSRQGCSEVLSPLIESNKGYVNNLIIMLSIDKIQMSNIRAADLDKSETLIMISTS